MYRAFGAWTELMVGLRNMTRVLKRFGKRHLAMAFDAWSGHHFTMARKRDAARADPTHRKALRFEVAGAAGFASVADLGWLCQSLPPPRKATDAHQSDPRENCQEVGRSRQERRRPQMEGLLSVYAHLERLFTKVRQAAFMRGVPDVDRPCTDHRPKKAAARSITPLPAAGAEALLLRGRVDGAPELEAALLIK